MINTFLQIVLVHYTVEATSIKYGVWNHRILRQDVLLVFPLFSRSNFQGIVHLKRNWWIVVWTYHLSNLSLGYISNLIRTLHKQPFFGLALITVPMYLHIATKTIKVWRDTFWSDVMNYKNAPNTLLNVTKYLPHRTFYPCFHFGSIGYYRKNNEDKHVISKTDNQQNW